MIATLIVSGDPVDGLPSLEEVSDNMYLYTTVSRDLRPIHPDEIKLTETEANLKDATTDMYRTRVITYSGWGHASYPYVNAPKLKDYNSMAIDGHKFNPDAPTPQMGLGTAEEWTIWNLSMTIYTDTEYVYGTDVTPKNPQSNIKSAASDHVFHIHQNPFWLISMTDSSGKEMLPGQLPAGKIR